MIYLIAGRPRSGKSYEAVKYHVMPAIQSGRKVITNLPLNVEHFKKVFGAHVVQLIQVVDFDYSDFDSAAVTFPFSTPDFYQDDWRDDNGVGPLYVIDEAHFSLPKGKTLDAVKKFYTMHGHYGVDILLMTQHPRQLDADVLNLVEILYRTIKNTALGSSKTYTKKVLDGWRGAVVNEEQRNYDKTVFPFYKSHTQSRKEVLEREAADIKPIWKHWSFIGAAIFLVFGIPFLIYSLASLDIGESEPEPVQVQALPSPPIVGQLSGVTVPGVEGTLEVLGPLSDFTLYVKGWARQMFVYDNPDEYKPGDNFYVVYVAVYKGDVEQFTVTSKELSGMGYKLEPLADCVYRLDYQDQVDVITCRPESRKKESGLLASFDQVPAPSFKV